MKKLSEDSENFSEENIFSKIDQKDKTNAIHEHFSEKEIYKNDFFLKNNFKKIEKPENLYDDFVFFNGKIHYLKNILDKNNNLNVKINYDFPKISNKIEENLEENEEEDEEEDFDEYFFEDEEIIKNLIQESEAEKKELLKKIFEENKNNLSEYQSFIYNNDFKNVF